MWEYQNTNNLQEDILCHYGVLGMKWGIRKNYGSKKPYVYKSYGQKRYEKKVSKLEKLAKSKDSLSYRRNRKLDISRRKLKMYQERDRNRQNYAQETSVGRSIAKTILFGPLGTGNYNRFRAAGHGRIVSALGSNWVSSTFGYPITVLASKSSENRQAKRVVNNN